MLASLAVLHRSPATSRHHLRAKRKALFAAYAAIARLPSTDILIDPLLTAADNHVKRPYLAVAALGVLAAHVRTLSSQQHERALAILCTVCLKRGVIVADQALLQGSRLIDQADQDILRGKALPVIDRALLREPEIALPSAARVLQWGAWALDVKDAKTLFTAVVQALKSAQEPTRNGAVHFAGVLGKKGTKDMVFEGIAILGKALKATKYIYQKVSNVHAIERLAKSATGAGVASAVEIIINWMGARKEKNDEVREAGIRSVVSLAVFAQLLEKDNSDALMKCVDLIHKVVKGETVTSDKHSLLLALTSDPPSSNLPLGCWVDKGKSIDFMKRFVESAAKSKGTDGLMALTVLLTWAGEGSSEVDEIGMDVLKTLVSSVASSLFLCDNSAFPALSAAKAVLHCSEWVVAQGHEAMDSALGTVFHLCLDERSEVSAEALKTVLRIRNSGDSNLHIKMFDILWETQFSGEHGGNSFARTYKFDDGMISAEKLGIALMQTVLPTIPSAIIPKVLMASNHPRLRPSRSYNGYMVPSRYWDAVERSLPTLNVSDYEGESEDWLEDSLSYIFGDMGMKSSLSHLHSAAQSSLCALADDQKDYSMRVLRRATAYIAPHALGASRLGQEEFLAIETIEEADRQEEASKLEALSSASGRTTNKKFGNTGSNSSRKKSESKKQLSGNAKKLQEKIAAARPIAMNAKRTIELSRHALNVIELLAVTAPKGIHVLTASMLSFVIASAKINALESECRCALLALTETCCPRLRPLAVDICTSLYGLESGLPVLDHILRIVHKLKELVPPAFDAEDLNLVSPALRACLLREAGGVPEEAKRGRNNASARREMIANEKLAANVLLEHCKRENIDAAIAAANSSAGSWLVKVLEREDGAFAIAADALALLTETALTPGTTQISQVLEGIISGKSSVRDAALAALSQIPQLSQPSIECPRDPVLGRSLWLARHDPDEANAQLADDLWKGYKHSLFVPEDAPGLMGLLAHPEPDVRVMSARAFATCLSGKENERTRNVCIGQMFSMYVRKLPSETPKENERPRSRSTVKRGRDRNEEENVDDGWTAREGVALAIEHMALSNAFRATDITVTFAFLSGRGLGDPNDKVREKMAGAATAIVQAAGKIGPPVLLPMIEKQLNANLPSSSSKEEIVHADRTRENLVMCLGNVASFLEPDDPRISKIADQVMKSAMETPSEVVQNAAARCLVRLARASFKNGEEGSVAKELFNKVWSDNEGYGVRRGASYALAGIAEGLGMKYLNRSNFMQQIEARFEGKDARQRQGAFILIETHALLMGRKFEPYAVAAIPFLLSCMGDTVIEVRNSCWAAAQAAMSELSSQGVKMILPYLLNGLQDRAWRTKAGSAEVLGAMAFCAPRQLAQCLPQVVPKLAEALADAHPKVVNSAESAINRIAAVVRSPEVRKLSPFLLSALRDPAGRTRGAVDAMLGTEFIHAIDAASLALLIPPLHRGLRDRSSELKKRAAAIVGSMCNNVANNLDVVPYLHLLLPTLQVTLLDAIPDVRRTSARAIGALAVSLGESSLPDIVPWLINALCGGSKGFSSKDGSSTLLSNAVISSSAERSGAAMGLAEVSASMTDRRLEDILRRILGAGQTSSEAREGGLMLIMYLPRTLGERFEGRLQTALTATLQGLADDSDSVREAALGSGRSLVTAYAKTSLELLLPQMLTAMREKVWRIRLAATRLLGDLLLVIAGANPEAQGIDGGNSPIENEEEKNEEDGEDGEEGDEDEEGEEFESPEQAAQAMSTEATMKAIENVLGFERRNHVLAALYIVRCDVSIRVRQTAVQVWKTVVANTPKVLREIMPSAVRQIVDGLGDEDEERRVAAGRTLGDLSQKLGDRVVPEVLPALQAGLKDSSDRVRRGACEGLCELVSASPVYQLEEHSEELIETVYECLCDGNHSVREVAASAFSGLVKPLGQNAVDAVIPRLIQRLSTGGEPGELALDGLRKILANNGARIVPIVVPSLLKDTPLKPSAARVLATAASVVPSAFEPHINPVTEAITNSIQMSEDGEELKALEGTIMAITSGGPRHVKLMLDEIGNSLNDGMALRRVAACKTYAAFCRSAEENDLLAVASRLLDILIRQLADVTDEGAKAGAEALKELITRLPARELISHISTIRESLRAASTSVTVGEGIVPIRALQVPKAPAPLVSVLIEGVLHGSPEIREQAALGIAELAERTNPKVLGPFAIKLVGSLIRVMSDRFPWQVKAAVLLALNTLLKLTPLFLRAFAPQLQSTLVKSLSDKNRVVLKRACMTLGSLVPIQARLEGLLNDLLNLGINAEEAATRTAAFHSVSQVMKFGKKLPDSTFGLVPGRLLDGLSDDDDDVRRAAAKAIGMVSSRSRDLTDYQAILELVVDEFKAVEDTKTQSGTLSALGAVYVGGKDFEDIEYLIVEQSALELQDALLSREEEVIASALNAASDLILLLSHAGRSDEEAELKREMAESIAEKAMQGNPVPVRTKALDALKKIVDVDEVVFSIAGTALVICAGETNTGLRSAADEVLKKGLLEGPEMTTREAMKDALMSGLNEDDKDFVERRIPKLRSLGESRPGENNM